MICCNLWKKKPKRRRVERNGHTHGDRSERKTKPLTRVKSVKWEKDSKIKSVIHVCLNQIKVEKNIVRARETGKKTKRPTWGSNPRH